MFLRFAVAFLEYSENLRLIRGGKQKGSLKIKNTSPKLSNVPLITLNYSTARVPVPVDKVITILTTL